MIPDSTALVNPPVTMEKEAYEDNDHSPYDGSNDEKFIARQQTSTTNLSLLALMFERERSRTWHS